MCTFEFKTYKSSFSFPHWQFCLFTLSWSWFDPIEARQSRLQTITPHFCSKKDFFFFVESVLVCGFGAFFPHMWFSSSWLRGLIWTLCENPPSANHNTANSPPSKWDQLSPVTRSRSTPKKRLHASTRSLTLRCQRAFKVADWLLSLCQVHQVNCSRRHSCFCLFTLCSCRGRSVTSPYYLYVHISSSIFIIIAFRMFAPRLEEKQCFHCLRLNLNKRSGPTQCEPEY